MRFWRTVEVFSPPEIPRIAPSQKVFDVSATGPLPWEAGHPLGGVPLQSGITWQHTLYGGAFDVERVRKLLEQTFGSDAESFDRRPPGESALFAFSVSDEGRPMLGTEQFCRCAWATGRLSLYGRKALGRLGGFEAAADGCTRAMERIVAAAAGDARAAELREKGIVVGCPLTMRHISELVEEIARRFGGARALAPRGARIASFPVPKRRKFIVETSDFLNSFIADDLQRVDRSVLRGDCGAALAGYLHGAAEPGRRIDVRATPDVVESLVSPEHTPAGRWPAPAEQALAVSQQFAVNCAIRELADGSGLFAVNGPPGTGKTTLLRELVAAVVVERASRLAELEDPAGAFTGEQFNWKADGRKRTISSLDDRLTGFEIVVASSNNGAVQNISAEIPAIGAIGAEWHASADYHAELATAIFERRRGPEGPPIQAWGLLAATLGRMSNRHQFAKAFWFTDKKTGLVGLRDRLEAWEQAPAVDWPAAAERFRSARREVESARAERVRVHRSLVDLRERRAQVNHLRDEAAKGRFGDAVPALGAEGRDDRARELTGSWNDIEWNAKRTELFLEALRLHAAFLAAEPRRMRKTLEAAIDVLRGQVPEARPDAVNAAWQALFLVVPVVSTTFASFARMFSHLGRESLGWLLIDEAGQAPPQAAAGAIWRSRRAVVVGDPMQLEPIVTLPFTAQQALRSYFRVEERWLPANSSVQRLADEACTYGTTLGSSADPVWVGAPLRAHRRCAEPMFTISNEVAYGGMMVHATPPHAPLSARESVWVDVPARIAEGHWVPAQGARAREILHALSQRDGIDPADIIVISPFRAVAGRIDVLRREFPGLRGGTIHTAQGKEASVVLLILGGDPSKPGARSWASERPNLLNVAVTRAKHRLYVIGDRDAWSQHPYFDRLAAHLPRFPPAR